VRSAGRARGLLAGLAVEPDGAIPALLVEAGGTTRPIPFGDDVTVEARRTVSAA
jgi:hypothetical protein